MQRCIITPQQVTYQQGNHTLSWGRGLPSLDPSVITMSPPQLDSINYNSSVPRPWRGRGRGRGSPHSAAALTRYHQATLASGQGPGAHRIFLNTKNANQNFPFPTNENYFCHRTVIKIDEQIKIEIKLYTLFVT